MLALEVPVAAAQNGPPPARGRHRASVGEANDGASAVAPYGAAEHSLHLERVQDASYVNQR